jgi:multidrug efflux pump subunit AcrB
MTLGGLALAVGILVDDATVTIENINGIWSRARTSMRRSWTARSRSCVPAFVSTLCICIVFVPMFFLTGRGALPVRAAGRGGGVRDDRSYVLSRTLVPTLAMYLLKPHAHGDRTARKPSRNPLQRFQLRGAASSALRDGYRDLLSAGAGARGRFVIGFWPGACCRSCWCRGWGATSSPPSTPARS